MRPTLDAQDAALRTCSCPAPPARPSQAYRWALLTHACVLRPTPARFRVLAAGKLGDDASASKMQFDRRLPPDAQVWMHGARCRALCVRAWLRDVRVCVGSICHGNRAAAAASAALACWCSAPGMPCPCAQLPCFLAGRPSRPCMRRSARGSGCWRCLRSGGWTQMPPQRRWSKLTMPSHENGCCAEPRLAGGS